MSVRLASGFRDYAGLSVAQRKLLYEPIILEEVLSQSSSVVKELPENHLPKTGDDLVSGSEGFKAFANKLAQVCDNEKGGSTITALVVLQGREGPEYVLASNARQENELNATAEFLKKLLFLAGGSLEELTQDQMDLEKQILWLVLSHNVPRLEQHRAYLKKALDDCLESHARQYKHNQNENLESSLRRLKEKCRFPVDAMRDQEEDHFCSACHSLIRAVDTEQTTEIKEAIREKARDSEMTHSQDWCELRHYLERWRSYGNAAKIIHHASKRWPPLFQDFKSRTLPSSNRMFKPIVKSDITVAIIIQGLAEADSTRAEADEAVSALLQQAEGLMVDLDEAVQVSVGKSSFRPIVHAEILVYDYLHRNGIMDHPGNYWNQWQYIASSKPTCRLCHYFFQSQTHHQIEVRRSHQNLYRNWRLPAIVDHDEPDLKEDYSQLLDRVAQKIRGDAKRTLQRKTTKGKPHDSNTYSTVYGMSQPRAASDTVGAGDSTNTLAETLSETTIQSEGDQGT